MLINKVVTLQSFRASNVSGVNMAKLIVLL